MAEGKATSTATASQTTPEEMRGLAQRLRARADSVLFKDQPHQAGDMRTAAGFLEQLAKLKGDIQRLVDETRDEVEQQHLRGLLEGL